MSCHRNGNFISHLISSLLFTYLSEGATGNNVKRIDQQRFPIYKIFNSVDVRDKKSLVYTINTYADGFFGQNEDYSVDIDRLELDIIKALKGG